MVSQRQSTVLREVEQLTLLPVRKACPPADLEYIKTLPNFRRAVRYSISLADLEPKQVYEPMEMDKAIWSRIDNGGMSFPADEIGKLSKITQNDAPLLWLNHNAGYDIGQMVRQKSAVEVENERLRKENEELRKERDVIVRFIQETRR